MSASAGARPVVAVLAGALVVMGAVGTVTTSASASSARPARLSSFTRSAADQTLAAGRSTRAGTPSRTGATGPARAAAAARSKAEQVLQVLAGPSGGSVADPSTAIAVSPSQVLVVTAQGARVYTKATGKPVGGVIPLNTLFGAPGAVGLSQPQAAYDAVGKRFVIAARSDHAGDVGILVRVSRGTTAANTKGSVAKSWFANVGYATNASGDPQPNAVESLPRLGLSSDKVVVTMAATDPDKVSTVARTLIVDLPKLEAGQVPGAWIADNNYTYAGQVPAVNSTASASAYVAVPDFPPISNNDLTALVYTWTKPDTTPNTAKVVVYPANAIVAPPAVPQPGAGAPDLQVGSGELQSAAWRSGMLWVATTVECPSDNTLACVRVWAINLVTDALAADEVLPAQGQSRYVPAVAVDRSGVVHVGYSLSSLGTTGPGFAVAARRAANVWSSRVVVAPPTTAYGTAQWAADAGAASDPTSPYDVWVAGAAASATVPSAANWASDAARASLAKYSLTLKASARSVRRGRSVTLTSRLTRPASTASVAGLTLKVQAKTSGSRRWSTVVSARTPASGTVKLTRKVRVTTSYRVVLAAARGSAGLSWSSVTSRAVTVTPR